MPPSSSRSTTRAAATESDALLSSSTSPREITDYHEERPRRLAYISMITFLLCFLAFATVVVLRPPSHFSRDYYGDVDMAQLMTRGVKSSKHKKKKHDKADSSAAALGRCNDGYYSKRTLQRAYELPFTALFQDSRGQTKYEASSVTVVGNDVYAVCDSSWAISKFGDELVPFAPTNVQIGDPKREEEVRLGSCVCSVKTQKDASS